MQAWREQLFNEPIFTQNPLFSALTEEQKDALRPHVELKSVDKRGILFHEGNSANHFFILRSGLFKLTRLSESGSEKVLEIIRPGENIALALMFLNRPSYPVTAEALQRSEVYQFANAPFMEMLRQSQETCFRIMGSLSVRMHKLVAEIESLSLKSAHQRFIDYILEHMDPASLERNQGRVDLGVPKHVLASKLSIKPESFSRLLRRLSEVDLIAVEKNTIVVKDCRALREAYASLGEVRC
uniref:Putative transcriptional regulator, Crp/Fnr family n=1 Tax=Magnetococcus massalia (strain MO-1) TaxID=451514 RepID=A0A1S7LFP8_MAGMO|nr:Putative transcriptional regulator, Crp/Fnr family [Candidatus Magnetococcus massalia]